MTGSIQLVDPEMRAGLQSLPPGILTAGDLPNMREKMRQMIAMAPVSERDGVTEQEIWIDGPAGPGKLRLHVTANETTDRPVPVFYHIHGGGYIVGEAGMSRSKHIPLAADLEITIVSVDYRLAPETPHPGPVEDCYAGLKWVFDNAGTLGIDRERIAIGGDSAGGGLAAALALLARDRGEVPICFQQLIYPMLDDRTCTAAEPHPFVGEFVWTKGNNTFGWSALLGHEPGIEGVSEYAAAARAKDLAGLPPTYIDTGALDLFLEENMEFARRLTRAGVPVEMHVYPGAYHGFQINGEARATRLQRELSEAALRRALRG